MEFGEKILQARKAKGMSQEGLAEAVGVSRQAVSKWETGEAKPDMDKLIALCKALELSMDALCLGKTQESTIHIPEPEQKPKKETWKWLIALIAGLLAGAILMGVLAGLERKEQTDRAAQVQYLLQNAKVENVSVESVTKQGSNYLRLKFVPSVQTDGLEIGVMVIRKGTSSGGRVQEVERVGGFCQYDYPRKDSGNVDVYAVFTLEGVQVQVKMCNLEFDEGTCSITHDWEEEN